MFTKLTLSINREVRDQAKEYASRHRRSLSGLVENFLKTLVEKEPKETRVTPKVKRLHGIISLPEDFDYKQALTNELMKKHLDK